ncbi:MAG: DUF4270 family protein [Bacteroidales bacterium]
MMRNNLLWVAAGLALLVSCNDPFTLTVGEEFVNPLHQGGDSRHPGPRSFHHAGRFRERTSGQGAMVVGSYQDEELGLIQCESYFQVVMPTTYSIHEDEIFDSISLVLTYNENYYGDTLSLQEYDLFPLTESLDSDDDGASYNISETAFGSDAVGTIRFRPRPVKNDSLSMLLDPALGQSMFDYMTGETSGEDGPSVTEFKEIYPGFVLMPRNSDGNLVLGFTANDSTLYLKIHTHLDGLQTTVQTYILPLTSRTLQYNRIRCDWSKNPALGGLKGDSLLPSSASGDRTFVQSGLGLYTKISFPGLAMAIEPANSIMFSALLSLEPADMTRWTKEVAANFRIYECDYYGNRGDPLVSESNADLTATFTYDEFYDETNSLVFDVTDYVGAEIQDRYVHPEFAFFLGMSGASNATSLDRILLGTDPKEYKNLKLKLTFFQYDQ